VCLRRPKTCIFWGKVTSELLFFVAEPIEGAPKMKSDPHFRTVHHSVNWNLVCMAGRLRLISMSICNVLSFLKIFNGKEPSSVKFTRFSDASLFDEPWQNSTGVTQASFDLPVTERDIRRVTVADLRKIMEAAMPKDDHIGPA
jgi:hypothetical protein